MKKRIRTLLLAAALCAGLALAARAAEIPTDKQQNRVRALVVSGTDLLAELKENPDLGYAYVDENGRTMVPLRALAEAMGLTVTWDSSAQTITLEGGTRGTVVFTMGEMGYTVGGVGYEMDTTPVAVAPGRTHVPVRFVAESAGGRVDAYLDGGRVTAVVNFSRDAVKPFPPSWAEDDYLPSEESFAYLPQYWDQILDLRARCEAGEDILEEISALDCQCRFDSGICYDFGLRYECVLLKAGCAAKGHIPENEWNFPDNLSNAVYTPAQQLSYVKWMARSLAASRSEVKQFLNGYLRQLTGLGVRDFPGFYHDGRAFLKDFDAKAFFAEDWFGGVRQDPVFSAMTGAKVVYDGRTITPYFAPYQSGNHTMFDLFTACYGLGFTHSQTNLTLTLKRGGVNPVEVRVTPDQSNVWINGRTVSMGKSAEVKYVGKLAYLAVPETFFTDVLGESAVYDEGADAWFIQRPEPFGASNLRPWLLGMTAAAAEATVGDPYLLGTFSRNARSQWNKETGATDYFPNNQEARSRLEETWGCTAAAGVRAAAEALLAAPGERPAYACLQAAQLLTWAYDCEYLSFEEMAALALPAAQAVQSRYESWDAVYEDYWALWAQADPSEKAEAKRGRWKEAYETLKEEQSWRGMLLDDALFKTEVRGT